MQKRGAGYLVVTAYTGVASAPFGGPTLLALVTSAHVAEHHMQERTRREAALGRCCGGGSCQRFASKGGVSLDDIVSESLNRLHEPALVAPPSALKKASSRSHCGRCACGPSLRRGTPPTVTYI